MSTLRVAAVAAAFGRDLDASYARIQRLVDDARVSGVSLLVLPEATLGGYLAHLDGGDDISLPPALDVDGPEVAHVAAIAGDMTVTFGLCESDGLHRFNSAVCVAGGAVIAVHRKVHQPLAEDASYSAGDRFAAFDSPVGRLGMMICYDKAFPEAARTLALDGAELLAVMSAWPVGRTASASVISEDRWTKRFNLFDQARALENQLVVVSANQTGTFGSLRFVANAKVVGPGGDILATTGDEAGLAIAEVDLSEMLATARRSMFHLRDRRPDAYGVPAHA